LGTFVDFHAAAGDEQPIADAIVGEQSLACSGRRAAC
jgi:hypothetical protein